MVRLNMTLFLQIALLFGHDIDDRARLKELAAIIAATGLATYTSQLPQLAYMQPLKKGAQRWRRRDDYKSAHWRGRYSVLSQG